MDMAGGLKNAIQKLDRKHERYQRSLICISCILWASCLRVRARFGRYCLHSARALSELLLIECHRSGISAINFIILVTCDCCSSQILFEVLRRPSIDYTVVTSMLVCVCELNERDIEITYIWKMYPSQSRHNTRHYSTILRRLVSEHVCAYFTNRLSSTVHCFCSLCHSWFSLF